MPLTKGKVVIDEKLVLKCLKNSEQEDDSILQHSDDIEFNELSTLRLSFESIFKIDNLENFVKLQTLSLDNNMIEKIQNLESLVNLTWLDLSFNQISVIEGLDSLTKLTDLSLFHNNIAEIGGLDNCAHIHVISLGHNKIKNLDSVKTLRRFSGLEVVNFAGNPICVDSDYKPFILAYLKHLRYLDYVLIEKSEVVTAKEQFQDFLQELEEKESLEDKSSQMKRSQGDQHAKIKAANLEMVDMLLQNMLKDDTEHDKLIHLPFLRDLLDDYQAQYTVTSEKFKTTVLLVHEVMGKEVAEFAAALKKARFASTQRVIDLMEGFAKRKKHCQRRITNGSTDTEAQKDLATLTRANRALKRELLELESETVEDFDDLISTFEIRFDELKLQMLDKYQVFFRGVEAVENSYSENVTSKTTELIEEFGKDPEMAVDENVAILLQDKESLMTSVVTSNDIHIGKLLSLEDEMRERFTKQCDDQLKGLYSEEKARNRSRVIEVDTTCESTTVEIAAFRREWVDHEYE